MILSRCPPCRLRAVRSSSSSYSSVRALINNKPLKGGQGFGSLLVLDFEATCDNRRTIKPQEVIEFPVLRVETQSWKVTSKFHRYVRPEVHPELSTFCTSLTGIIQDMVDGEDNLPNVLQDFDRWLSEEGLTDFAVVTCGDWDLAQLLPTQLRHLGLPVPPYFRQWINLKVIFSQATGVYPRNLPHMLAHLGLPQLGRLHSGIDDCRNMAGVIEALEKRTTKGCSWHLTSREP